MKHKTKRIRAMCPTCGENKQVQEDHDTVGYVIYSSYEARDEDEISRHECYCRTCGQHFDMEIAWDTSSRTIARAKG